jgi:phage-related protein
MSRIWDNAMVRKAVFHIRARETIQGFPDEARMDIGQAISDLQRGLLLTMPQSRPMAEVGPGVHELRVRDAAGTYRVFYYLRDARGVLVFHAFAKKSQKTPLEEIAIGKRRLKEMLSELR